MNRFASCLLLMVLLYIIGMCSCRPKIQETVTGPSTAYPDSIAHILVAKCTNAGCHNQASYQNAGELLLDTWAHLLQGGVSGAVVVAYSTTYSPLLYYVCPDSSLGTVVNDPGHLPAPLSAAEYQTLANWIAHGAPDKNGDIPFASDPDTRQKIYLTISGCNYVAVIDAASRLVMRQIPVGTEFSKNLHDIAVSSDGRYAYVSLYNGTIMQKIDTRTDTVVGSADLSSLAVATQAGWSILYLSPMDTAISLTGYYNGYMVTTNTATLTNDFGSSAEVNNTAFGTASTLIDPHGITANASFDTFFITEQSGNIITKLYFINRQQRYHNISIDGFPPNADSTSTSPNPHQIQMAPDYSKYFVTCQNSNEVRVMDAHTDSVLAVIPVGAFPQEMALSISKHYLFVVCMEDAANSRTGALGSVYVIDYTTLQVVTVLYGDFYQPHDIAVDEMDALVYICSTNANPSGPAPHHVPVCNGRAGWYTVYDLNTFQMDNKRYQVDVFPYAIANRF